jgi:hypothetical protein
MTVTTAAFSMAYGQLFIPLTGKLGIQVGLDDPRNSLTHFESCTPEFVEVAATETHQYAQIFF